jgi:D-beta-D-heptose 7-phosphate kinase/D-beta-D-heptose 1-phosphate adenosyltransferase
VKDRLTILIESKEIRLLPNSHFGAELALALGLSPDGGDALLRAAEVLLNLERLGLRRLGFHARRRGDVAGGTVHIPAAAPTVFDVSGAGDAVIAALAATLAAGLDPVEGAQLANLAAGIIVAQVGTVLVD